MTPKRKPSEVVVTIRTSADVRVLAARRKGKSVVVMRKCARWLMANWISYESLLNLGASATDWMLC